jgi:hypothetical protein
MLSIARPICYLLFPALLIQAALIAGCAVGLTRDRVSEPTPEGPRLPTKRVTYVGDMFVAGDIEFLISPYNTTGKETMILPFPHTFKEPEARIRPFYATIYLRVSKPGFSISLDGVKYWIDPAQTFAPSRAQSPVACDSVQKPPPYEELPSSPITLKANACTVIWVEFNADTPDPVQTFFMQISALTFDGEAVSLPILRFEQAKHTHTVAVP